MSSRRGNGSGPKSKKPVATPAKSSAQKGSKPSRSRPGSKPRQARRNPKASLHPRQLYDSAVGLDRKISQVPIVGQVYDYGKTLVGKKVKDYVSGILSLGNEEAKGNKLSLAPVGVMNETSRFINLSTGRAAPHGDYPEGGIRISGELINNENDVIGMLDSNAGTAPTTGIWMSATSGHSPGNGANQFLSVSPTAYLNSTYANSNMMFGLGANVVSQTAQFHRNFRFRKLGIIYEGELGTNPTVAGQSGSVQFSYDRDLNSLFSNLSTSGGANQAKASTAITKRIPTWTPRNVIWFINDMKTSLSDRLHLCTASNIGMSTGLANADIEEYFQGGIAGVTDATQQASSSVIFARYRWIFVLDLYGLNPTAADGAITYGLARGFVPAEFPKEKRYALAQATERILRKRQEEMEDEIDENLRELLEEMKEIDSDVNIDELFHLHARKGFLTRMKSSSEVTSASFRPQCDSTTGCGMLDCKTCWKRATSTREHQLLKSMMENEVLDDVKQTEPSLPLVIPALVKPVELKSSLPNADDISRVAERKALSDWESTISSLRKRYAEIVGEQKRRSNAVLCDSVYVLQPEDKSDAELEADRARLAEELRIIREELRRWRDRPLKS